jgi:hypothetical protein
MKDYLPLYNMYKDHPRHLIDTHRQPEAVREFHVSVYNSTSGLAEPQKSAQLLVANPQHKKRNKDRTRQIISICLIMYIHWKKSMNKEEMNPI